MSRALLEPEAPGVGAFTSEMILRSLQELHRPPEWATFAELADGTGGTKSRTADLLAFHLWPSQGYRTLVYEVKVDRADFRRELDKPEKRRPWEGLVSETWFAAPPRVIPHAEIPEGWGLIEVTAEGEIKRPIRARQREYQGEWPRSFVASLARRSADPAPAPKELWTWLGQPVGAAKLRRLAELLVNRDHQRRGSLVPDDYETREAARVREDRQRTGGLANMVGRLCGWKVDSAETFREWFDHNGKSDGHMVARVTGLLESALETLNPKRTPKLPEE